MTRADRRANWVRRELERQGSPAYARRVQMFFKVRVRAYGWRTEEMRTFAREARREILETDGPAVLFAVAEKLFAGGTLEEQNMGVALLEPAVARFGEKEFRRLERWLRHVGNWSACDALCYSLLGPMIIAGKRRVPCASRWARSRNHWHRRAAAVALVPAARRGLYLPQILRLAKQLLPDKEYMVQKGLGWLLKEAGKTHRAEVAKFLVSVRERAPRVVLRTACEKLPARERRRILAPVVQRS
ncbi:MAG: DNA alkylation repair protein [Terriglobia bacterium]